MTQPLILGSMGQVGRALARVASGPALWHGRTGAGLNWDLTRDTAPDLPLISGVVSLARGPDPATEIALAEAACRIGEAHGVPVLIASTQAVYGPGQGALTEDHPCAPTSDYGRTKLAMEQAVKTRATCLRIGNVVGCDMLLMNAAKGPVTLDQLPDGTSPRRAYIGAPVLWDVLVGLLAQDDLPDVINLAQPGLIEMADLLRAADLRWDWRDGAGALAELALDVTLLQGFVPVPAATPEDLIAQARAAGWGPA